MSLLSLLRGGSGGFMESRSDLDDWGPNRLWSDIGTGSVSSTSAYNLSTVWACQTLIADAIGTLPVDAYRQAGDVRKEVTKPSWLVKPNPEWNRIEFETQRIMSLLGWGNAYTLLVRRGGTHDPMDPVVERWLLNPSAMVVRRVHDPTNVRDEIGYWYLGTKLDTENVQHIRGYVLPGMYQGMSPIANMNRTLVASVEAQSAGVAFYQQGMMPAGVLQIPSMPAETNKEILKGLREQLADAHAGSKNSGKPLVLTGGTTWNQTSINPTDALLLETRRFEINEICRWYRVPPHKVSDIVNHASQGGGKGVEQQATEFAQDTLLPWTARLEEADSALLPRGQYVKYNLDASIRSDLLTRYTAFKTARDGGWLSANDVRSIEDLPPVDNGDIYLMPANTTEAGASPTEAVPSGPAASPASLPDTPPPAAATEGDT